MLARPIILNARAHASLRLRPQQGFGFAGQLHMAAVMQPEFVRVAALYPIVFVEDRSFDSFRPMALLGLKTGENLFVGADGRWGASYVPAVVRAHPFALGPAAPGDHIAVCVDAAATTTEPGLGVALFDPEGQPAPALREAMAFLSRLRQMQVLTDAFCRALAERNLFTPFTVRVRRGDEVLEVGGCYVIHEDRLEGLSDARLSGLRQRGWLAAAHAHLVSLMQIERLEAGPLATAPGQSAAFHGVRT